MLVGDVLGLDHPDRLLHLVTPREVGAEGAVHDLDVARFHVVDVVVARAPDAPLHHLELPPVDLAGGEHEAQQLVGGLGPAIPVVRAGRHLGGDHLHLARPDQALVVVGRVVGAAHHHAPHALLEGGAVDVVGERDVVVLGPELRLAVLLPGGSVQSRRADIPAVDDGIRALEMLAVGVAVPLRQVRDHDARDGLARPRRSPHVDGDEIPPVRELAEHALGDVPRRPRENYASLGHCLSPRC